MAYFRKGMPQPQPADRDEAPFFDACRERRLVIQRCVDCGKHRHPPVPVCAECGSEKFDWAQRDGTGEVFTYTIVHHPVHPALKEAVPYNVVQIMLDGSDDVRIVSNVIDATPEEMRIGLRVALEWDAAPEGGGFLPRFRKA